jgi:tRNA-2-methylthio-N6-dimethylallyladenosine synthase
MKVGVLGCMAERLKEISRRRKIVDLVVGPDAYKDLPNLLAEVEEGRHQCNLSKDETYGDISPVRLMSNGITALVSITRGCDNMCTFCGPFTRGRERSREPQSIMKEIQDLWDKGKEITPWTKCRQLPVVWRVEISQLLLKYKSNAVDFDQLLEMTAVSFPK